MFRSKQYAALLQNFFQHVLCAAMCVCMGSMAAQSQEPTRFTVSSEIVQPSVPNISATINSYGAGHRFMPGGDFEPVIYRDWFLAEADAPQGQPGRILASRGVLTRSDSLRSGALDGAEVSVLRIEQGRFKEVRRGTIPEGGFQIGAWHPVQRRNKIIPSADTEMKFQLPWWHRPDVLVWLSVRAMERNGSFSQFAEPVQVQLPASFPKKRAKITPPRYTSQQYDPDAAAASRRLSAPRALSAQIDDTGTITLRWREPESRRRLAGYVVYMANEDPQTFKGVYIDTKSEGAPIQSGDLIVLRHMLHKPERGTFLSNRLWNTTDGIAALLSGVVSFWPNEEPGRDWEYVPHQESRSRNWGGTSALRLDLAAGQSAVLGGYNHAGTDQDWRPVLRSDQPYKLSVRVRADRPGQAMFRLKGRLARDVAPITLDYDTQWRELTAEFVIPRIVTEAGPVGQMLLEFKGPAQIYVDDLRVHRADVPYLDYSDEEYSRIVQAKLSALRTHGLIKTEHRTYDLKELLSADGIGTSLSHQTPGLPHTLSMMRRAGAAPWLQIEPHFSRQEWLGLIEYLAAPFDPDKDSAEDLPWAALRVSQGQLAPWTDAFDTLYFELGNETWNRLFSPWNFHAMRDAVTWETYSRGTVYGLYQTYVADILRSSPWWKGSGLEEKTQFVIGGWNGFNYGTQAARAAPNASDLLSIASYNGGWDQNEGPPDRTPYSFFNVLNQVSQSTIPAAQSAAGDAADIARSQNRALTVGTYEAGPGYALNGLNNARVTPEQARAQEEVMKSQAAGVATLDSFLAERVEGFAMQNFFTFGEGAYWKSHAHWYEGGAPYPSWALLSLLNTVGQGDMLQVQGDNVPGEDLKEFRRRIAVRNAPQVAVYATRTTDRLTVFAISRKVPDFPKRGDRGCTSIQIDLPVLDARSLTLFRTAGSYDDHSVDGKPPQIEEVPLPVHKGADGRVRIDMLDGVAGCGLPAASAYIYVIDDPVFME